MAQVKLQDYVFHHINNNENKTGRELSVISDLKQVEQWWEMKA